MVLSRLVILGITQPGAALELVVGPLGLQYQLGFVCCKWP